MAPAMAARALSSSRSASGAVGRGGGAAPFITTAPLSLPLYLSKSALVFTSTRTGVAETTPLVPRDQALGHAMRGEYCGWASSTETFSRDQPRPKVPHGSRPAL